MLRQRVRRVLAPLLTVLLLLGMAGQKLTDTDASAVEAAHHRLALIETTVPLTADQWIGRNIETPPPAIAPLQPVRAVSREFEHIPTGRTVTLRLLRCNDRRGLLGYDPPRWYAARRWQVIDRREVAVPIGTRPVTATEYAFARSLEATGPRCIVVGLVILPTGVTSPALSDLETLASPALVPRSHGAVLVQMEFPAETAQHERQQIMQTLMHVTMMTIEKVSSGDLP